MTILVEKTAKTLEEGVQNLIEGSKKDYAQWTMRCSEADGKESRSTYFQESLDKFEDNCRVEEGRNYIKVIRENSVHCFVMKKVTDKLAAKGFKVGDVLKPAGWKAPALNKARGNVLEGNYPIQWTGPLYLV